MNIGDRLLNYEILAPLGRGGFGAVYLARDVNLEINVALKVLHAEFSKSETMLHRLRIGARAAARLRHPNIQTVHYMGRDPATQLDFVVMEYLPGGTLRQRITLRPLPMAESLSAFSTICGAVDSAHRHGVIHRDLKPDNIMYDADGKLVVTDFDLARVTGETRHTGSGQTLGTLLYISPEQARGDEVDHRTDVYSLGVMLFELMTGRWPFMGENAGDILNGHLYLSPPLPSEFNPKVPNHVDDAVMRALSKSPADRFEAARALACAATGQPYQPEAGGVPLEQNVEVAPAPPGSVAQTLVPTGRRASLRIQSQRGPQVGQQFAVGKGVSMGYGKKKNDIHIEDEYVSSAHARIDLHDKAYEIMDLKSTNGTKVNGKKIEPYTSVPLAAGDQIEIGYTVLIFELSG